MTGGLFLLPIHSSNPSLTFSVASVLVGVSTLGSGLAFFQSSSPGIAITSSEDNNNPGKKRSGFYLGVFLFVQFGAGVFGPVIGGSLEEIGGYSFSYGFVSIVGLIGFVLTLLFMQNHKSTISTGKPVLPLRELLRFKRKLRRFYLATTFDTIGWSLLLGIFFSLLITYRDYTVSDLVLVSTIFNLFVGLSQIPGGWLVDHVKKRILFTASALISLVSVLIWLVDQSLLVITLGFVIFSASVATFVPTVYAYISESVSVEERATEIGKWNAFRGVISLPMPFLAGFLAEEVGFYGPIIISFVVLVITTVLYAFVEETTPTE